MGRYIDWPDVTGRYKAAAAIAGETSVGSYWLEHAEGEVDGRLAPRYAVPFAAPAPQLVKDLSIDLTYYKMTLGGDHADKLWEYIENRFKAIIDGTLLITTSGGAIGQSDLAWASNSYHTSFGPDAPEKWQVSSQWIGDVESQRGQF